MQYLELNSIDLSREVRVSVGFAYLKVSELGMLVLGSSKIVGNILTQEITVLLALIIVYFCQIYSILQSYNIISQNSFINHFILS
jgi:hypothetical protein